MNMESSVLSLRKLSLEKLMKVLDRNLSRVQTIPLCVRIDVLRMACKRGLVNDDSVEYLLVPNVVDLDLSHSDRIGDKTLIVIADQCRYLTKINLNWPVKPVDLSTDSLTDRGVVQLAKSCPNLVSIMCRNRGNLTNAAAVCIAERCKRLTSLDMGGSQLDDGALRSLAQHAQSLRSLNVSFTNVTSAGFEALCSESSSACFSTLEEVHTTNCSQICDEAVRSIANLPRINIFIFHNCRLVTQESRGFLDDILLRQQRRARNLPRGVRKQTVQMSWTVY